MGAAIALIDRGVGELGQLYGNAQDAMTGSLSLAFDHTDALGPRASQVLRAGVTGIVDGMGEAIANKFERLMMIMLDFGYEGAKVISAAARQDAIEVQADALTEFRLNLRANLLADAAAVEQTFRRFQWEGRLDVLSGRRTRSGAIVHARMQMSDVAFRRANLAGRNVTTQELTRLAARKALLGAYNDSLVIALAYGGIDVARAVRQDATKDEVAHEDFSIAGATAGLRVYQDIRDEVFHPNANTIAERIE